MREGKHHLYTQNDDTEILASFNVLVVEDETIIAMDEAFMLEDVGLNVVGIAHEGNDAVCLAKSFRPDLILMDVDLGKGVDGIEAFERIRKEMPVKVVFITGHHTDDVRIRKIQQLQDTWIIRKPFNCCQLQRLIRDILSHNHIGVINGIQWIV